MDDLATTRQTPRALPPKAPKPLNGRQKAAVIVRLLFAEGAPVRLSGLPDHLQAELTEEISVMRLIDRTTLRHVIEEFVGELESVGLSFPGGLEGALAMLDGHISTDTALRMRRLAGLAVNADPWDRVLGQPPEKLIAVLEAESIEVGAVMLSKLPVARAAELLGQLPGERARRVAYAVSQTGRVAPEMVRRIGAAIASQFEAEPPRAFEGDPVDRVGAILNVALATTRDDVLAGLDATDAAFATRVRKAIFTFANIPARLEARDVPKVIRGVPQAVLVTALAAATATEPEAAEFILANMSQRMAGTLREEMAALGKIRDKDAEAAMNDVVAAIRDRVAAGEIRLIVADE